MPDRGSVTSSEPHFRENVAVGAKQTCNLCYNNNITTNPDICYITVHVSEKLFLD